MRTGNMNESHNIKTLEKLPMQRLKTLLRKYMSKGTKAARKEASTVKRIMSSRKMSYNEARELIENALEEMAQTPERQKQIRDQMVTGHTRTLQHKADDEKRSGWTYDIDGKKVKKPKAVDPAKEAYRKKKSLVRWLGPGSKFDDPYEKGNWVRSVKEAVDKESMPCNKPRASTSPGKKKMVKACEGGRKLKRVPSVTRGDYFG